MVMETNDPSETELAANVVMMRHLEELSEVGEPLFETMDGNSKRNAVCEKVEGILKAWVEDLGSRRKQGVKECEWKDGGGTELHIFGSQRLGVHNSSSDIDMLAVMPGFVFRDDFFATFVSLLGARDDVSLLLPIPEAYTPVVKFHIDDQAVDLLMVTLNQRTVPKDLDILDVSCLQGLDVQGVRCMNGPRVAESILRLVPNSESYSSTLRVIKYWARQRGLYSNVLGFLGGVNFAIMVAFVCQRYPHACPAGLVKRFFNLFCQWRWPAPVMLEGLEDVAGKSTTLLPVWNPKVDPKDRSHLMPIITPAYPAMNSAYNISMPQFRLIQEEIQRAQTICYAARDGGPEVEAALWTKLLASSAKEFFQRHPRYVQVDLIGNTAEKHRMWFGWCESRMRQLFLSLERPPHHYSQPLATCFHREVPAFSSAPDVPPPPPGVMPHPNGDASSSRCGNGSGSEGGTSSNAHANGQNGNGTGPDDSADGEKSVASKRKGESSDVAGLGPSTDLSGSVLYSSSFFVGLAFSPGVKHVDVTAQIQEYCYRISNWAKHLPGMDVQLSMHTMNTVPAFVRHEDTIKAPSGTSGCTPKRRRAGSLSPGPNSPVRGGGSSGHDFADLMVLSTTSPLAAAKTPITTPIKKR